MNSVAVVTDSTHYLPVELIAEQQIHVVSLYVNWGEGPIRESAISNYEEFYGRLREGREFPTTSQPSVGDYLEVYEPLLEAGHDVFSVHLSGGISGTVGAAEQAKALLEEKGLTGRIEVVDSRTAAGGHGAMVLAAARRARAGAALADVASHVAAARDELEVWFCLDTLEYLQRGGRIGKAQAWIGGALKVKPILSISEMITPVERVRTAGRAFERMVEYLGSLHARGADGWIVQHIQAHEQCERLVAHGREIFGSAPVFVSQVGPVLGSYTGPGMIGVGGLPARYVEG